MRDFELIIDIRYFPCLDYLKLIIDIHYILKRRRISAVFVVRPVIPGDFSSPFKQRSTPRSEEETRPHRDRNSIKQ